MYYNSKKVTVANKISDYYKVAEDLNKALTLDLILIFISINKPVIVDAFAYLFKLWIHSYRFLLLLSILKLVQKVEA